MGEYKFRAFNKREKKYYYNVENVYDYLNDIPETQFSDFFDKDYWFLEQFIGKQDRNNVDIYKGDILLVHSVSRKFEGVVYYYSEKAKFILMLRDGTVNDKAFDIYGQYQLEIIGNTHEGVKKENENK